MNFLAVLASMTPDQIFMLPLRYFFEVTAAITGYNSVTNADGFYGFVIELLIRALAGKKLKIAKRRQIDLPRYQFHDTPDGKRKNCEIKCNRSQISREQMQKVSTVIYCPLITLEDAEYPIGALPIYKMDKDVFERMLVEQGLVTKQRKKQVDTGNVQIQAMYNHSQGRFTWEAKYIELLNWLDDNAERLTPEMFGK